AALLERGMAEAIIGGALVAILEHLVGLVDLLELVLAVLVARIAVRVILHGELAEGGLEVAVTATALDPQDLVVVALRHGVAVCPHGTVTPLSSYIQLTRCLVGSCEQSPSWKRPQIQNRPRVGPGGDVNF